MRRVYWRTEAYEANAEDSYASCETAVNLDMRTEAGRKSESLRLAIRLPGISRVATLPRNRPGFDRVLNASWNGTRKPLILRPATVYPHSLPSMPCASCLSHTHARLPHLPPLRLCPAASVGSARHSSDSSVRTGEYAECMKIHHPCRPGTLLAGSSESAAPSPNPTSRCGLAHMPSQYCTTTRAASALSGERTSGESKQRLRLRFNTVTVTASETSRRHAYGRRRRRPRDKGPGARAVVPLFRTAGYCLQSCAPASSARLCR